MYHRLVNEDEPEDHLPNDQISFELKNRHKERKAVEWSVDTEQSKVDFIYHTIKPLETLQGLALRYACTVSQLRLHNHLMSDQEFHALSVLKIPVTKNGILKETFADQTQPVPTHQSVDNLIDISEPATSANLKTQVINIGISNYLSNNGSEDYRKFLNNLSEDFKEMRKSTQYKLENSTAPSRAELDLGSTQANSPAANKSAFLSCDGSDFGIHWRYLIVVLVIVCFLVPSYVLFNLEHHNTTTNGHTGH